MKTRRGFCFTAVVCLFGLAMTSMVYFGHSKEMEVTKEWQLVGENDTIPAGMHIRMDMTTGSMLGIKASAGSAPKAASMASVGEPDTTANPSNFSARSAAS